MKIVLGGNHKLSVDVLKFLISKKEDIQLIIAEGLDSKWELNFEEKGKELAKKANTPFLIGDINSYSDEIEKIKPDLIILCRCKKKIKNKILSIPKIGCTNIHFGLLPKYGGIAPIHWAIRNGEEKIGVTLQFMSEKFDEGDIIDQKTFLTKSIKRYVHLGKRKLTIDGITAWEAYNMANKMGFEIFEENFLRLKNGIYKKVKQDLTKKLYYTKDSINYEEDRIIDLTNKSEEEISALIRAFTFPPCQLPATYINNKLFNLEIESN